jgi:hypothetical protein
MAGSVARADERCLTNDIVTPTCIAHLSGVALTQGKAVPKVEKNFSLGAAQLIHSGVQIAGFARFCSY